jgi:hypothetical protein
MCIGHDGAGVGEIPSQTTVDSLCQSLWPVSGHLRVCEGRTFSPGSLRPAARSGLSNRLADENAKRRFRVPASAAIGSAGRWK